MEKNDFLFELTYELSCGILAESEDLEKPIIDLFDSSRSDTAKVYDYIIKNFNHAFVVAINDDYGARQFVPQKNKFIPNSYMQAHHVFGDYELQNLAYELFYDLFVWEASDYRLFVANYLSEKEEILSDLNAQKYLNLLDIKSTLGIINWFVDTGIKFISREQIAKFIHQNEVNNINQEAFLKKLKNYA